jgi:hypothetical protein
MQAKDCGEFWESGRPPSVPAARSPLPGDMYQIGAVGFVVILLRSIIATQTS